ncbi:M48 family metallopeptidase [Methanobacterium movens]
MKNKVEIADIEVDYQVVYRKIKYPRLEIKTGNLILILPHGYNNHQELIEKHQKWIYNKISIINSSHTKKLHDRTEEELKILVESEISAIAYQMGVIPGKIGFRKMKVRWGSCDRDGNLKFNKMMKYLPENLIKYIIYHEMAHLLEFGHNTIFWNIIKSKYPHYSHLEEELSRYYFAIENYHKAHP